MRQTIKIGDIVAILIVLLLTAIIAFLPVVKHAKYVVITVDGKEYAKYNLVPDTKETLKISTEFGQNTIVIEDGKVLVSNSSCKNKIEISAGAISKAGQSLVCSPNRLVITIEGGVKPDATTF